MRSRPSADATASVSVSKAERHASPGLPAMGHLRSTRGASEAQEGDVQSARLAARAAVALTSDAVTPQSSPAREIQVNGEEDGPSGRQLRRRFRSNDGSRSLPSDSPSEKNRDKHRRGSARTKENGRS